MIENQPNGTTVRMQLPWPDPILNPNVHTPWAAKNKPRQIQREACYYLAKNTGVELDPAKRYEVRLTFCPPSHAPRDMDNLVAALKSGLDGMCRALGIDDRQIVPTPDKEWGPVVAAGKVEVTIVEIPS